MKESSPTEGQRPAIVFHHPLPIFDEGTSGSRIRPVRMIRAFEEGGYAVDVVAGSSGERMRAIQRVRQRRANGRDYRFLYAESATIATPLADSHHLPLRPAMDFRFMREMRAHGAAVGLFYRDVHWRFPQYGNVAWYKKLVTVPFYCYEWLQYRRSVDHLFLPSDRMADALPGEWPADRREALPPGCVIHDDASNPTPGEEDDLRVFYVGGIEPPLYDLTRLVESVASLERIALTLCCREEEWEEWRSYYASAAENESIRVVHARGEGLWPHFAAADVFALVWEVGEYQKLAMPVKIMEAIGHGVPIITDADTEVARLVRREEIGWVVQSTAQLRRCLARLRDEPDRLSAPTRRIRTVRAKHTWEERAKQVSRRLEPGERPSRNSQLP